MNSTNTQLLRSLLLLLFLFVSAAISQSLEATTRVKVNDVSRAGDVLQFVLPGYAAALTIAYKDYQGAYELFETASATIVTTDALKYLIQEKRPDGGTLSFPSGHTSISFAASGFIQQRYGLKYALPAYAASIFVAYSRLSCHYHWTQDVVAGAAIGLIASFFFTSPYEWDVYPAVTSDSASVYIEGNF